MIYTTITFCLCKQKTKFTIKESNGLTSLDELLILSLKFIANLLGIRSLKVFVNIFYYRPIEKWK